MKETQSPVTTNSTMEQTLEMQRDKAERYGTVIPCTIEMRYKMRKPKCLTGGWVRSGSSNHCHLKQTPALAVSTTALALVARPGMHDSLVDLPFRASLVAGLGLRRTTTRVNALSIDGPIHRMYVPEYPTDSSDPRYPWTYHDHHREGDPSRSWPNHEPSVEC